MRILRDAYFVAIALNHLAVDLLNSQKEILLVFVPPSLGLSNADIGLVVLIYAVVGSFSQPIFGLAADVYPLALVLQTNSILILMAALVLIVTLRRDTGSGGVPSVAVGWRFARRATCMR